MTRSRWWTLAVVAIGTFMLLIDITIVNIALPDIAKGLGASFNDLQWMIDTYAIALAALLLTAGSLGDLVGHRKVFAGGLGVFSLASLGCGFAQSPLFLNAMRAIQGIGGAAMFACSLALLGRAYHGRDRAKAMGVWGATAGVAVAAGPLIGGALTSGASWRWIFYVNVPIGALALALLLRTVDETERRQSRPDVPGFVTFSGALFAGVYGLIRGNADGWSSAQIVGAFAAAGALTSAFLLIESKRRHPMLDLRLFRRPAIVGASVAAIALSGSLFAMFLYIVLYLQNILGYSAMQTGLRFLPLTGLVLVGAGISGRLSDKAPARAMLAIGLGLVGGGLALMAGVKVGDGWTTLLAGFLVGGVGAGLVNPALANAAVGTVDREKVGVGSGINNTARQVGIAAGIAALGAIFQSHVRSDFLSTLSSRAPGLAGHSRALADRVTSGQLAHALHGLDPHAQQAVVISAKTAFISGFNDILWVAAVVAWAGAVVALALVRKQDFVAHEERAA